MAKSTTATKEKKAPAKDEPQFSVDDLVEASGLKPASVRVALRELNVEKMFGNKYGWKTKKDFDVIVKALKERSAKRIVGKASDGDSTPAKKTPAKKAPAKRTPRK